MDGWRKPKRKAVDPPGASSAPEPDAREPSDRRGGDAPATQTDALPADALPPAFANGDLAPVLFRLREDLESTKRLFAAHKEKNASTSFAPGERERLLLSTQDALLSATERLTSARAERDAARAETKHAEEKRRRADEQFARAAAAEADAAAELHETRREMARLKQKQKHERAPRGSNGVANANDGGPSTTATAHASDADTPHDGNVVAALTVRAETAERRADVLRVALEESNAFKTKRDDELRGLRESVASLEKTLAVRTAEKNELEATLRARDLKQNDLCDSLKAARKEAEDLNSRRLFLENTLLSHRDAARLETDALRVAVDAAAKANAEAEKSRVLLVEETRRLQTELTNAKAELERCKKNARDAADKTERFKEETRSSRSAFELCERRLKRVVSAMRVVDDAVMHVRAVARGDEEYDVPETAEDMENDFDKNGGKAFPASLAESLGPTRRARDSRRDDAHIAAAREGASTFPDADPLADSVPASAEAAPVTAPVPQRRGKRQRMTMQK